MPTAVRSSSQDVRVQFDALLARCGAKERATIERHLAICDSEPDPAHGQIWRRLAAKLGSLVPLGMQTIGQLSIMFFVPDGKYRMQVFALEDNRDGQLHLYMPDILAQAVRAKILLKPATEGAYGIGASKREVLIVSAMDAANTNEPPPHVKHMLGWNRKAVRVTLTPSDVDGPQIAAVEALCTLAAEKWAGAVLPVK